MTESPDTTRLIEEIAAIEKFLDAATQIITTGQMPDITSLEGRVATLCKDIQTGPTSVHEICLPKLVKLMEQLNETEKQMRRWKDARQKTRQ
jgi:hypothetical protein